MRREFTRKVRQAAIERAGGHCDKCHAVLKPREAEVDHILPDILGGEPTLANAQCLCRICHAEKTADDVRRTRKADRQRDKASGAMRSKAKIASRVTDKQPKQPKQPLERRPLYAADLWQRGELAKPGRNSDDG